eukprot:CAMPEP_0198738250 /NCGR_PEP_ID=MMETSP1475-20131203/68277_1 /TAXON_ID= ORGANISM="Unidentified sp., Strain CCMP1999" /NCGR_SAMPLE_ID=MMETSP1475 /ASSEMBLY_ACC=CAM_ASM_001111 /LENGTH=296 /DNA_ID=CAMNT_0044502121 /DNA_START=60 /DNA_END=947 /DNA_ORIENTATION=-
MSDTDSSSSSLDELPLSPEEKVIQRKRTQMHLRHDVTLKKFETNNVFKKSTSTQKSKEEEVSGKKTGIELVDLDLELKEYGKRCKRWASDIVVLHDNTLRAELQDLRVMLTQLGKRITRISYNEVDYLLIWWDIFQSYVAAFLTVDADVLFPMLADKESFPEELSTAYRQKITTNVYAQIMTIDEQIESGNLQRQPPGTFIQTICKFYNEVGPVLLDYYARKEKILPEMFERYFDDKTKRKIEKRFQRKLVREEIRGESVGACQRWMEPDARSRWKRQALGIRCMVSFKAWSMRWE